MTHRSASSTTPSKKIPVSQFRQIFHLPLSLWDPNGGDGPKAQMQRLFDQFDAAANWSPAQRGFTDTDGPRSYEEAAYFHDFVRDFLYEKDEDRAHRSYCRTDLQSKQLDFHLSRGDFGFTIDTLELDLFTFGVAILTLEIVSTGPLRLNQVLDLIDHDRRAFPGYWAGELPGLCPKAVTIDGTRYDAGTRQQQVDHLKTSGALRLFPWWREILAPLRLLGEPGAADTPIWRHVLDERVPVMSYIALPDAAAFKQISDGDWFRIAAADEAGTDAMPYNSDFLAAQRDQLFYDRHFPCDKSTSLTRQCFAGYHYAIVGARDFFGTYIQTHFRSHYRRMNFIAQLEFAAMLTFSRRLTDLAKDPEKSGFRDKLLAVREDFLAFTHSYIFTDVSNHLQAREMNARLRASMSLDALRHDVEEELRAASDFAIAREQRDMGLSQEILTRFATLFLPATLATGFAGMNILAGFFGNSGDIGLLGGLAELMFWVFVAYWIGLAVYRRIRRSDDSVPDRIGPLLQGIVQVAFFATLISAVLAWKLAS